MLAFSGLFDVLQASFFLPRIESVYTSDLSALARVIESYHSANFESFKKVAQQDFVAASFTPNLADATIKQWADAKSRLGVFGIRLLGSDGRRILYSTFLDLDANEQAAQRVVYKNYNEDGKDIPAGDLLVLPTDAPRLVLDGERGRFVYCVPVAGPTPGTLIFYVSVKDLLGQLALSAGSPVEQVSLVGNAGVLINGPSAIPGIADALIPIWERNTGSAPFVTSLPLKAPDGTTATFRAFSARLSQGGVASMLVPSRRFEMTDPMKGLLLATFFLTVFLLLYLLMNLRSDPLEVLRQRVKRFQIQLITELVESPGGADWGKWRREMEARKDEITWQIQRGIGRVSRRKKPVIDEYMDKSWGEIIDLISRRVETPAAAVRRDGSFPPRSIDTDGAAERELRAAGSRRGAGVPRTAGGRDQRVGDRRRDAGSSCFT